MLSVKSVSVLIEELDCDREVVIDECESERDCVVDVEAVPVDVKGHRLVSTVGATDVTLKRAFFNPSMIRGEKPLQPKSQEERGGNRNDSGRFVDRTSGLREYSSRETLRNMGWSELPVMAMCGAEIIGSSTGASSSIDTMNNEKGVSSGISESWGEFSMILLSIVKEMTVSFGAAVELVVVLPIVSMPTSVRTPATRLAYGLCGVYCLGIDTLTMLY